MFTSEQMNIPKTSILTFYSGIADSRQSAVHFLTVENQKNSLRSPCLRMIGTPLRKWPVAIPSSKAEAEIKLCVIAFFPDQLQPSTFDNESTSCIARQHATNSDFRNGDGKEEGSVR
jgi:hypothetical protein